MRADATYTVESLVAVDADLPSVVTATPVGLATMTKRFSGAVDGSSVTVFTSAFDQGSGVGTYLAMESFDGSVDGRAGTFNFAHSATTHGGDRCDELFVIVPSSGTADLAGITGTGGMGLDDDGTHRIWFEYEMG